MRYICTGGGRCVVGWCLDSPCGGSITGSLNGIYPFVLRINNNGGYPPCRILRGRVALVVSVGRNQECVPACCAILRYSYINLLFVLGDDRYLRVWYYPVVSRAHQRCLGASRCVICSFRLGCLRLVSYCN